MGIALAFPVRDRLLLDGRRRVVGPPRTVLDGGGDRIYAAVQRRGCLDRDGLALPVSLLAARHQRRWSAGWNAPRSSSKASPVVVVGLALVYLGSRYLGSLYQSPEMLRRRLHG